MHFMVSTNTEDICIVISGHLSKLKTVILIFMYSYFMRIVVATINIYLRHVCILRCFCISSFTDCLLLSALSVFLNEAVQFSKIYFSNQNTTLYFPTKNSKFLS